MATPRPEFIHCVADAIAGDPSFDIETFVRRVLRNDRKMRSGAVDKADSLAREGQQSVHVNYDENGQLSSDPLGIPEEQAAYWVELARWAAELQKFWSASWEKQKVG